jgi:hypothetical protein
MPHALVLVFGILITIVVADRSGSLTILATT